MESIITAIVGFILVMVIKSAKEPRVKAEMRKIYPRRTDLLVRVRQWKTKGVSF
jgi:hypothetical protein